VHASDELAIAWDGTERCRRYRTQCVTCARLKLYYSTCLVVVVVTIRYKTVKQVSFSISLSMVRYNSHYDVFGRGVTGQMPYKSFYRFVSFGVKCEERETFLS
jgi:hypothetical protein